MEAIEDDPEFLPPERGRRSFLKGLGAAVLGLGALLVAPIAGLRTLLHPLRSPPPQEPETWIHITNLSALPNDGVPRRFPVVSGRVNAWTRETAVPVGAVFLCRTGETSITAFNVVCPHAGCTVGYLAASRQYLCPCHNSTFAIDGSIDDPGSPSKRGLDPLEVEIRDAIQVWVRFQSFRTGIKERLALS
jgi:Rieske Fe-S protein